MNQHNDLNDSLSLRGRYQCFMFAVLKYKCSRKSGQNKNRHETMAELPCDNYPGQNKNRHETMAELPCDNYPGQNKNRHETMAELTCDNYPGQNKNRHETMAELTCDNYPGQNKNRHDLWYLAWRVAIGLHQSITLNLLAAGHSKFAPDWGFWLLRQEFKRQVISSQSDIESVVCGNACVNIARLGGCEDRTS